MQTPLRTMLVLEVLFKKHKYQNADWRLRPLPDEMLRYAREDTHYLLHIYDLMRIRLLSASTESENSDEPLVERHSGTQPQSSNDLPHVDDDSDEEMEIVEEADQVGVQSTNAMHVGNLGTSGDPQPNTSESACDENEGCNDTDVIMEEVSEQVDEHEIITFWLSVESQIYSQCNIYEAGQKKVAFKYLTEKAAGVDNTFWRKFDREEYLERAREREQKVVTPIAPLSQQTLATPCQAAYYCSVYECVVKA
ncbi:hypothetical protein HYC85_011205 [Camellia sinensis]|uniref:3'-5' exonuclease domain-containing protein n=1 Tax=Camellia sinensis TaxID=4442 RepID=A0A7J7HM24_CAMSI|nr:hypothetical protein HYC85_011205 [Camellia sinensis]